MLRSSAILPLFALFLMLLLSPLGAFGAENAGKELHDSECLRCHGVEMYRREKLFVKSYPQLEAQVRACATRNKVTWDDDQIDEVAEYLADDFYGFE